MTLVIAGIAALRGSTATTVTNIVVGGATLALVTVTAIYVDLTRDVAKASSDAAESASAAVEYSRRAMEVSELRYLAAELPVVFPEWLRTIQEMHPNDSPEAVYQLAMREHALRLRIQALRNRLSVNDDYIATEIDSALGAYLEWLDAFDGDTKATEVQLPDTVVMACTACLVFVTANLPARVRQVIRDGTYWVGPEGSDESAVLDFEVD